MAPPKRATLAPITARRDLIAFAERLDGVREIGFDTEFHAEQTYWPKVMLLQFSTPDELVLVDPLAPEVKASLGGFLELFRMRKQVLVGHALERDLEIFLRLNGGLPVRVFDTQIAAAFVGLGGPISLAALLQARLGIEVEKLYTQADWGKRPLPPAQAAYAADDVRHLLPLAESLREELDARGRLDWVEEEHARLLNPQAYLPADPSEAWRRVGRKPPARTRARAVLEAVAAERERIARETDRPARKVLSDDVLVDLAKRAPTETKHLDSDTRRRPAPNLERYSRRWLEAIQVGLGAPLDEGPGEPLPLPAGARAAVDLGRLLAEWMLEAEDISPWLLPSLEAALQEVVRVVPRDRDALRAGLGLGGWRDHLLLEPLWQLYGERRGIRIVDGLDGLRAELSVVEPD